MADICEISPSNTSRLAGPVVSEARPETLGHLSFAVGPAHNTMYTEAESQLSRVFQSQGRQEYGFEEADASD